MIVGDRKFVEIPGSEPVELPPLLVRSAPKQRLDKIMDLAADIVESEDLLPVYAEPVAGPALDAALLDHDRRKMDLVLNLVDRYLQLVQHWQWGDSILEWIRQCETTFERSHALRPLLRADVWPHAGRSSFVTLLSDKQVRHENVDLPRAVGTRLSFRQPPPIACCSNQFLFYLNSTVAVSAYDAWSAMSPDPVSALPPERFHFQVVEM